MKQPKGNRITPVNREDLQKRVNIPPVFYRHQHTIVVFALIKGVYIVKIEIHDMDLGMVFPDIVPQKVHIAAPFPAHEHRFSP